MSDDELLAVVTIVVRIGSASGDAPVPIPSAKTFRLLDESGRLFEWHSVSYACSEPSDGPPAGSGHALVPPLAPGEDCRIEPQFIVPRDVGGLTLEWAPVQDEPGIAATFDLP